MNSIQFISNRVDRVINHTPPNTPIRSRSVVSLGRAPQSDNHDTRDDTDDSQVHFREKRQQLELIDESLELALQQQQQRQYELKRRSASSPSLLSMTFGRRHEDQNTTTAKTDGSIGGAQKKLQLQQQEDLIPIMAPFQSPARRLAAFISGVFLFLPLQICRFFAFLGLWLGLAANTNKASDTISPPSSLASVTPEAGSAQQKPLPSGFFAAAAGWLPFFSTPATPTTNPALPQQVKLHQQQQDLTEVTRLPQRQPSDELPATPKSKSTTTRSSRSRSVTPGDKPKTRPRKSSSSTGSKSPRTPKSSESTANTASTSISSSPTNIESSSSPAPSTPKRRKSPLAYAFKFPRIYAPPRPLLPPQSFKPLSLWQLFSLSLSSPKQPSQQPSSSPSPFLSVDDGYASDTSTAATPVHGFPLQISSNANATHYKRLKRKTLVLDLDETLIHTLSRSPGFSQGSMVEVKLNSSYATLYTVLKRPFCDEFLQTVSQWYNLVIFTASVQAYADPMIDWLERDRKYFVQRYYRQHCTQTNMGYVKDLGAVDPDLANVLIIDNSPVSYLCNNANGIGIEGWINDPSDNCLLSLIPFLAAIRFTTDVRSILGLKAGDKAFT